MVTEATVRLVEAPEARALAVLGYADESAAAEAAPGLLPYCPLTVEGMAADLVREPAGLPRGGAWLFVETGGATPAEARARAEQILRAADALDAAVVTDPAGQRALWRIREDASGTATRMPDGSEAWPGWEDCAVPPARLGPYLREFRALLTAHGLRGTPYGHFGDGCIHVRIDFDLLSGDGVARFRRFSEELATLVVAHGGSLSGEHGDGQARAELLPRMYGDELVALFGRFKDLWDPDGGMNPGVLARPARLDENLRFDVLPTRPVDVTFGYPHDGGDFSAAVRRCVGVAKCRTAQAPGKGVMCPSFRVTGEEAHSTRGRARLLHEMLAGEVITDGWRSKEVRDALDLCLSCKGCRSDCPVGVDMATYKAEFLHHHYRGRLRPAAHYVMVAAGVAEARGPVRARAEPAGPDPPARRTGETARGHRCGADDSGAGGGDVHPVGGQARGPGDGAPVERPGGDGLAGHLHQPPLPGGRQGGCPGPGGGGPDSSVPGTGCVLRPHLRIDGPAGQGPQGHAPHAGPDGALPRRPARRPRTELRRHPPYGPPGTPPRRPPCRRTSLLRTHFGAVPGGVRPDWQPPRLDRPVASTRPTATSTPSSATRRNDGCVNAPDWKGN